MGDRHGNTDMGQKEKLIARLKSRPKDFTFDEAEKLLNCLGYKRDNKGKTSGSGVSFIKDGCRNINMHRPHPRKELLSYQIGILIRSKEYSEKQEDPCEHIL